jgi:LuxR family transcriptional regulator, maltose regulon positive regulatory protein
MDELSARERDVLQLLPTALSEAEIGQELFISYHTVHSHVRTIYRKLGTTSRAQTVERARATGLLLTPVGQRVGGAGRPA